MSRFARGLAAAVLALALVPAQAAEPVGGVATIVEGGATLVRGTARFGLAEGVRLSPGDIVETPPAARLLRIEFDDGGYANLGPATRLLLGPKLAERGRPNAAVYLLQGWLKTAGPVLSPAIDVAQAKAALVLSVGAEGTRLFSESGPVGFVDRHDAARSLTLPAGQLFERVPPAGKPVMLARPTPAFLQSLPPPFLDTLPPLSDRFKGRTVPAKPLGEAAYPELQPWLVAEPALRRSLQPRWLPLARQPAFRQALVEHLPAHPEWERVLFPERFQPAAASARPGAAPAPAPLPAYADPKGPR